jgi:hypothetical protein
MGAVHPGQVGDAGDFRAGDVLSVACPFTPARVERGVTWGCVSVRWPWWRIDTDSDVVRWNGIVALGVPGSGRAAPEAEAELFRTDPPPDRLGTGCWPMTQYAWDVGLVAVSREEAGLIWSFDAR